MRKHKVAVLDNECNTHDYYRRILQSWGHDAVVIHGLSTVVDVAVNEQPDVLIADIREPSKTAMVILDKIRRACPQLPVVICTAYASVETAVEAIKAGAFDYIIKPFTIDSFRAVIDKALRNQRPLSYQPPSGDLSLFPGQQMIGNSPQMHALSALIQKVGRTEANVLVQGESGTGKELVAHWIHLASARSSRQFIPLDCATLPGPLMESELFGHEKGAFTGAVHSKQGMFEVANSGTIFLDEIGEMPISLQAKLLRVLQEKNFRRLGATKLSNTDVRVIAATNRDLDTDRKTGRFREDLYYRLGVITIQVPPLRERTSDIRLLAEHFARMFAQRNGRHWNGISGSALQLLEAYPWPGNVRELQNAMEHAVTLCDHDLLTPADLPPSVRLHRIQPTESAMPDLAFKRARQRFMSKFELEYLNRLLEMTSYNISRVARISGLHRRTIYRLMEKHGIVNLRAAEAFDAENESVHTGTWGHHSPMMVHSMD